jgi:hypothetical protein
MSKGHASVVRRGQQTPHVPMWRALAELVDVNLATDQAGRRPQQDIPRTRRAVGCSRTL